MCKKKKSPPKYFGLYMEIIFSNTEVIQEECKIFEKIQSIGHPSFSIHHRQQQYTDSVKIASFHP